MTASIACALLLPLGSVHVTAAPVVHKVNENNGSDPAVQVISDAIDEYFSDSDPDGDKDNVYYGVFNTGKNAKTDISATDTIISANGRHHKYDAYGIYNENGAHTTSSGLNNININSSNFSAGAFGIYSDGNGSSFITANGSTPRIHAGANVNVNSDDIITSSPDGMAMGIISSNSASNDVTAESVDAQTNAYYDLQSKNQLPDDLRLTELNTAVDTAADIYAKALDQYDIQSNEQAYWDALNKARNELDTAIDNYNQFAVKNTAVGVSADNKASNNVRVNNGDLTANNETNFQISPDVITDDATVIYRDRSIGVYADHDGKNNVAGDHNILGKSDMHFYGTSNSSTDGRIRLLESIVSAGVYSDNGGENIITPCTSDDLDIKAEADLQDSINDNPSTPNHYVPIALGRLQSFNVEADGIGSNNKAHNIVRAHDITSTGSIGDMSSSGQRVVKAYMNGIKADNGGINEVTANDIKAQLSASIDDSLNAAAIQTYDAVYSARGVAGSNGGKNYVTAHDILSQPTEYNGSIGVSNFEGYYNGTIDKMSNIYSVFFNTQAIYGYNGAYNEINANNITAQLGNDYTPFTMNIGQMWSPNTTVADGKNRIDAPIIVRGVSADEHSVNKVTATGDIKALVKNWNRNIYYSAGDSVAIDNYQDSIMLNSEVSGIYGNNGSENIVTANNITAGIDNVSLSLNGDFNTSNLKSIIKSPFNIFGVRALNNSHNTVTATGTIDSHINNLQSTIELILSNNVKANIYAPITVSGVYGDNAVNDVTAGAISAKMTIGSIDFSGFSRPTDADVHADIPITIQGVYGGANAINNVTADSISAVLGDDTADPLSQSRSVGDRVSALQMPFKVAGVYGENGAINSITTNLITARQLVDHDSSYMSRPLLSTATDVYGIYSENSATNLHSKTPGGTVDIRVESVKSAGNVNEYGIYADNAIMNFYDNVKVENVGSGDNVVTDPVETYLRNAQINFAGYVSDYKNPLDPYDFDAQHSNYENNILGSGVFHTYASDTGKLNLQGSDHFTVNTDLAHNKSDKMTFASLDTSSSGTHYVSVASDPSVKLDAKGTIYGKSDVIKITDDGNAITADGNRFIFSDPGHNLKDVDFGGKTFVREDALRQYRLTPHVATENDNGSKNVVITQIDYDTTAPSTGMTTANNSKMALRNIMLAEEGQNSTLMQRMGQLRAGEVHDDGLWTKYAKGKLTDKGTYDSGFTQRYNEFSLGYDKKRDAAHGALYTGLAINHFDGDVGYDRGSGHSKSTGVSIYGTYLSENGHYLDIVGKVEQLKNDFNVTSIDGKKIGADYDTPAYGLSAEYGYRKNLANGYFIEPQAQFSFNHINGVDYHMTDGTLVQQDIMNSEIGRVGVLAGRNFTNGNVYFTASALHEFGDAGSITGCNGDDVKKVASQGYGTWYELGIGTSFMVNDVNFYLDISKSFSGHVRKDYQINAGARWMF